MMAENQTPQYIKKADFEILRFGEIQGDVYTESNIKKTAINAFFDPGTDHGDAWDSYQEAMASVRQFRFDLESHPDVTDQLYGEKRESVLQIINEITVLKNLGHEGVVSIVVKQHTLDNIEIAMPLYRGTIEDYITAQTQNIINIVSFTESMESVLKYIHKAGVVHNDIHPGNIMLKDDGSPVLIDFGLAHVLCKPSQEGCVACCVPMDDEDVKGNTLRYKPPHLQRVCSTQIDVWAMAMVVLEVGSKTSWSALLDGCPVRPFDWEQILTAECIQKFIIAAKTTWPDGTEAESIFQTRADCVTDIPHPNGELLAQVTSSGSEPICIESWEKYDPGTKDVTSIDDNDDNDDDWYNSGIEGESSSVSGYE
jgi:serine/threonine protein kinase